MELRELKILRERKLKTEFEPGPHEPDDYEVLYR